MKAEWVQVKNGIELNLQGMIKRGKSLSSYANRVLVKQFKQAQEERWQTENSSQGAPWEPLEPNYKKQKLKKFAAYPGGGSHTMIATNRLTEAAQLKNTSNYLKSVTDQNVTIAINTSSLPYAIYPGVMRPYMSFSQDTLRSWVKGLANYMMTGKTPT